MRHTLARTAATRMGGSTALLAWLLLTWLLLGGCTTPVAGTATQTPAQRVAALRPPDSPPVSPTVVGLLTQAMASRLSVLPADLVSSLRIEHFLGLNSDKPAYLAYVQRGYCSTGNCAYGLFVEDQGQLRELYFAELAQAPLVMPESHYGFADLGTQLQVDDSQIRTARLRWDGEMFTEVFCSLVSRVTGTPRPCVASTHHQVVTEARLPATLCDQTKAMLSRPLHRIQTQTVMKNAFLVRGDAIAHTEAIKVRGNVIASSKRLLLGCLRSRGPAEVLALDEPAPGTADSRATDLVHVRVSGIDTGAVDVTLGLAYFKQRDLTLVTVGISQAPPWPLSR